MRADMFKVIVERPRWGSRGAPSPKLRKDKDPRKQIGLKRHAGEQASHAGARHPPEFGPPRRLGGIRRIEAGQQQLGDVRDTRQRRQRQHGAHRGQRRRGDQLPADRGQHLPERARCGRGDCGRAHEIGLPRCW